jgi:hypothetical protein
MFALLAAGAAVYAGVAAGTGVYAAYRSIGSTLPMTFSYLRRPIRADSVLTVAVKWGFAASVLGSMSLAAGALWPIYWPVVIYNKVMYREAGNDAVQG